MSDTIHLTGYIRLPERSSYNHNYYQNNDTGDVLLEVCYEQYNSYEIYREENGILEFVGSSDTSLEDGDVVAYSNIT